MKEEVKLGAQEELEGERGDRNNINTVFMYKVLKILNISILKGSLLQKGPQ